MPLPDELILGVGTGAGDAAAGNHTHSGANVTVSTTAPVSPAVGDVWIDSDATSTLEHTHSGASVASSMTPTTGQYWVPAGGSGSATNGMPVYQTLWAVPIYIPAAITFTRLCCYVDTAVASSEVRLGIYSPSATNQPGTLLLDAGVVSAATTGAKEATIAESLASGLYWLGAAIQTVTGAKLRAFSGYTNPNGLIPVDAANATAPDKHVWAVSGVTGALPASPTWGVINSGNQGPPILFLKV